MEVGLDGNLLGTACAVGLVSILFARRYLPLAGALAVVMVKVGIPLAYFALFYDGTWNFIDDITYAEHGRILLAAGYNPFTVLFRPDGLGLLIELSLGLHILYAWWNHLAQYLFGPHYYSAVFLNVALTFAAAGLLYRIARLAEFGTQYARGLALFFLLHWELLAWSSFLNAKDMVVLALSIAAFYFFLQVTLVPRGIRSRAFHLVGLAVTLVLCLWIRFYVSFLLLGAFGAWILLKRRGWKKYLLLGAVAGGMLLLPSRVPAGLVQLYPAAAAAGVVQFALTPRPWSIEPAYTFLRIPSLLHWLFFVPAVAGAYLLWRYSAIGALMLIYMGVTLLFYAVVPELQGPRYRIQVTFIWAWMQFHAVYELLRMIAPERWAPAPAAPVPLLTGRMAA